MGIVENILIVDDSADDAELIVHALRRGGHQVKFERVDTPDAMLAALKQESWDLIIADYAMPHFSGLAAFKLLKDLDLDLPFILVSGAVGEEVAVQAMKAGAQDYILKHNLTRLAPAVERELRDAEGRRERVQAEARYRSLFERVPVGVFSATAEGKILEANPALVQMLGFSNVEDLKRCNPDALWVDRDELVRRNTLLVRDGIIRNFESQIRRPDGTIIWCSESVRAEYHVPGMVVAHFEGVAVDITDRKRVQEELTQARDAALEAVRLKSDFLANMSHEIRTPLHGIVGVCELLRDGTLTEEQAEYAGLIGTSADSLLAIVNDILDFSKISAGKLVFETIDFELTSKVEETLDLFAEPIRKKGLELILEIDPAIPPLVRGDPMRLRQVLSNLVGNAVKFTEQGEVVVSISLVRKENLEVVLRFIISDTGIGISQDAQRLIFEPFHQADGSTTRKFGGTGLGLAISRQLVERMGGRVELESEPGKGSTFAFDAHFGRNAAEETSDPAPAQQTGGPAAAQEALRDRRQRFRILVAEDSLTGQTAAAHQLRKVGYVADVVGNGIEALNALAIKRYQLVLMDCMMPEMDGLAATAELRRREVGTGRHCIAIAMIAHAMDEDRERCRAAGMDDYIGKPVQLEQLTALLDRWLIGTEPASSGGEDRAIASDRL